MIKEFKPKKMIATVILLVLMSSTVCAFFAPNAHASELTAQEKGTAVLSNAVSLELEKYVISTQEFPNDLYLGILPQESIRYSLDSNGSKLDILCTFINGSLQMIEVLAKEGPPQMTTTGASAVGMAQSFLSTYQTLTRNSFYGELSSTLSRIEMKNNSETIFDNTKLKVTTSENDSTFRWTFMTNGIEAPNKCVTLRFKDGFLKYFVDNWELYKVGFTNVYLSEKEAIDIAMTAAKNYSWNAQSDNKSLGAIKFNVANAMIVGTILAPSLYAYPNKAHSQDLLELYPMRQVWVSLDKFYPGNVYGIDVYVWADTKEVCYVHERVSTMDPPADLVASISDAIPEQSINRTTVVETKSNLTPYVWTILPTLAVALIILIPVRLFSKNKSLLSSLPRLRFSMTGGLLLICLLLISSMMAVAISASSASAAPYNGGAVIWGSESKGSWNTTNGESWRKTNNEVSCQQNISSFIAGEFTSNGYTANNFQGTNSMKYEILGNVSANNATYGSRMAVVDFDHGNGRIETNLSGAPSSEFHYMFEDNYGTIEGQTAWGSSANANSHAVYDTEIYNRTNGVYFALISACNSANINDTFAVYPSSQGLVDGSRARGMPFAWTHKLVGTNSTNQPAGNMSADGYRFPDGNGNCYIGFDGGSAALNQSLEGTGYSYSYWLYHFFYFALRDDYTIHQALDIASQAIFTADFDQTCLYDGGSFNATWPMYINGSWRTSWNGTNFFGPGYMKVYGNADLKLYEPTLSVLARDDYGYSVNSAHFYVDTNNVGISGSSLKLFPSPATHTFDVSVPSGYTFDHFFFNFSGANQFSYYSHPVSTDIHHNCTLTAYFDQIPTHTITASSDAHSGISPSGAVYVTQGNSRDFTMSADPGYHITHVYVESSDQGAITYYNFDDVESDQSISVYSAINTYAITTNAGLGGSISPSNTQYVNYGDDSTEFTITADPGYHILDVVAGGSSQGATGTYTFYNVQANDEISATFQVDLPVYTITTSAGSGGSISPSSTQYVTQGDDSTEFTITADPGYHILDVVAGGSSQGATGTYTFYNVQANDEISATFEADPPAQYYVTLVALDEYSNPLDTAVYLDGNYVAQSGSAFQVTTGQHTIAVDANIHDYDAYYWVFSTFDFDNNNPGYLTVTSDAEVYAYYYYTTLGK